MEKLKELIAAYVSWGADHKFLRDFIEGLVAAFVGGAAMAVLNLTLSTATASSVLQAAIFGAFAATIAYARHKLEELYLPPK